MTDSLQQFIADAKRVAMRDAEKNAMRGTLISFMQSRSSAPYTAAIASNGRLRQALRGVFGFSRTLSRKVAVVALFTVLATGGTSFAAESSLPGDALYSWKTGVNENIVAVFAVTPAVKSAWEARRIERRVKEAERLAQAERLDLDARLALEMRISEHSGKIAEQVMLLAASDDGPATVRAENRLVASLDAAEAVLRVLEESAREPEEIGALADAVELEKDIAKLLRLPDDLETDKSGLPLPLGETEKEEVEREREAEEKRKQESNGQKTQSASPERNRGEHGKNDGLGNKQEEGVPPGDKREKENNRAQDVVVEEYIAALEAEARDVAEDISNAEAETSLNEAGLDAN